jgi:hypothetical protein
LVSGSDLRRGTVLGSSNTSSGRYDLVESVESAEEENEENGPVTTHTQTGTDISSAVSTVSGCPVVTGSAVGGVSPVITATGDTPSPHDLPALIVHDESHRISTHTMATLLAQALNMDDIPLCQSTLEYFMLDVTAARASLLSSG